jgi:flagellum-specific peptidoglycan hydrolase FlgJ
MVRKKEPFRVYDTIEESFRDHARFLIENPRYKNAFQYSDDPVKFALEVAKA